jgi:predicted nuclease of predicted toxin-antitoxin system
VKLRLDENLPHDLTADLAGRGHDVHTVHTVHDEQLAGHSDPVVVRAAAGEGRMVLTLDRGVGDLRHYPPVSHGGIVVLRPTSQDPDTVVELVDRFLSACSLGDLRECTVIVEPECTGLPSRRKPSAGGSPVAVFEGGPELVLVDLPYGEWWGGGREACRAA